MIYQLIENQEQNKNRKDIIKDYQESGQSIQFYCLGVESQKEHFITGFTASCQQFGINPWTYLRDTLIKLPSTPIEQSHTLLPIK